ncbi:MAG: ATP-binding protein, partial [Oligoflexia bacterium]|nr:ATP-binding protein [Oligoflexia bacterium]
QNIVIEADPLQIKETISNILNNAYDAVPKEDGKIDITTENRGDYIGIFIKDNGIGIPDEHMQKIFDPFFSTKAKGTGLGLAVCRQIVDFHKGKILIESKPGKGTTVNIELPLKHNRLDIKKKD